MHALNDTRIGLYKPLRRGLETEVHDKVTGTGAPETTCEEGVQEEISRTLPVDVKHHVYLLTREKRPLDVLFFCFFVLCVCGFFLCVCGLFCFCCCLLLMFFFWGGARPHSLHV